MARRLLTVSELVDRCSPPNEEYRTTWLRRARDWSSIGLLHTSHRQHEGSGRHRLYSPHTVYVAAVLFRMADLGVPIGNLTRIARLIQKPRRTKHELEFKRFWEKAKDLVAHPQVEGADAYLAITLEPGGPDVSPTFYDHSWGPIELKDDLAWVTINLTVTFRRLKP
jgi:DNA-binding transcriptional MerR regulator